MNRRTCIIALAIGCLLVLFASSTVFAASKMEASGILTSIEEDGTVIIKKPSVGKTSSGISKIKKHDINKNKNGENGQSTGYLLSPSVIVQDHRGKSISLKDIPLPYNVNFEYEYTPKGFMIIFIKENAG